MYDIPVAATSFTGNEKKYVDDCMESGWISSAGKYVELFEREFAEFCGIRHAIACSSGTAALHLALLAYNVQPGDEIIVPTLTFAATPNAVRYCGAKPVFVDAEAETWNIDPKKIEAEITPRTKGIIAVHLYGHPAQMTQLKEIARRHKLFLLEDAAEAHGANWEGKTIGSVGDIAAFSFYANKIITTGEGGMVTTDDDELAERARLFHGQGMDPNRRYWHPVIGYNYRLTNLSAAVGLAQLEKIEEHLESRKKIAELYRERLANAPGIIFQTKQTAATHVYWMFSIVLEPEIWQSRDEVIKRLGEEKIETRPLFYPAHSLPPYADPARTGTFPVAEYLSANGLSLPTWTGLTVSDIDRVCESLLQCRKSLSKSGAARRVSYA